MINSKERDIIIKSVNDTDNKLLRVFTQFPNSYKTKFSGEATRTLRKALYINNVLIYRLGLYVYNKKLIYREIDDFITKLELVNNMISVYNLNACNSNSDIIEIAAGGLKIVKFKSGKIQLQNRYLKRTIEKLKNKHKKILCYYYQLSIELEKYIHDNNLNDFVSTNIYRLIEELKSDISYDKRISYDFSSEDKKVTAICRHDLFTELEEIEDWETCNF